MKNSICNLLFLLLFMFSISKLSGQWKNDTADNGFEKPRKSAFCLCSDEGKVNNLLSIRKPLNDTAKKLWFEFWALESKFCEGFPKIDLSFQMDTGRFVLYDIEAVRMDFMYQNLSEEDRASLKNIILISPNMLFWNQNQLQGAFSKCSKLRVRINDGVCGSETYMFDMKGSAAALKWVNGQ